MSGPEPAGGGASPVSPLTAAARRIADVRSSLGDGAVRLAYHAAVPVVMDAELLNLLRVNFFLDPPAALPFEVEAALLLSPLFREVGDGLYEIEPGLRNLLLSGLQREYDDSRVRRVATLLERYTDASAAWRALPELEMAQRLTAVSFLDPSAAREWLDGAGPGGSPDASLGREWYVAMERRIDDQAAVLSVDGEIEAMLSRLNPARPVEERLALIRDLDALARLPGPHAHMVMDGLCDYIQAWDALSPGPSKRVTPDVQAALTLMGTIYGYGDLTGVVLTGADLAGLDLGWARWEDVMLTETRAVGVDLSYATFKNVVLADVVLDGARLESARMHFHSLRRVSMRGVSIDEDTEVSASIAEDVTATDATGAPILITVRAPAGESAAQPEAPVPAEEGSTVQLATAELGPVLDRARQAEESGDWARARDEYQAAVYLTDERDPVPLAGLARAHARLGVLSDAIRCYQQAITLYEQRAGLSGLQPGHAEALMDLAAIWQRADRADDAIRLFEEAWSIYARLDDQVGAGRALLGKAGAHDDAGDLGSAEEASRRAALLFLMAPAPRETANARALSTGFLARQRKFAEASASAKSAAGAFIDLGDLNAALDLLRTTAQACSAAGKHDNAITLYRRAIEAEPGDVAARRGLAESLFIVGSYGEADAAYREAINLAPGDRDTHQAVYRILDALHNQGRITVSYEKTADGQRRPDNVIRGGLGYVVTERGDRLGTFFHVAPGVMVTALHVIGDSVRVGTTVTVNRADSTATYLATVARVDRVHDLAILKSISVMQFSGTTFAPAASMVSSQEVSVLTPDHPPVPGAWIAGIVNGDAMIGGVAQTTPSMSGAPVIRSRDGAVVGMVVAERPGAESMQLSLASAEDIVALLDGLADVTLNA